MKINLVMIVRDEERYLERCMKSAVHLVDHMVITDTGSTDRTREIARNMGALVLEYGWNNDFSAARNFGLDHSDGDWNLVLDADETLRFYSREALEERISRLSDGWGQAWMGAITRYDSYQDGDGTSVSTSLIPRLLPRGIRYAGIIHEQPDTGIPCYPLLLEADHDGYVSCDKGERNLPYLEKAVNLYPEDVYYRFQMAATLRNMKRLEDSLDWFRGFYKMAPPQAGYRTEGVLSYLYTLLDLGGPACLDEAWDIIRREKPVLGKRADFCFLCGLFYMKLVLSDVKQYYHLLPGIENSFLECLRIGEHPEQGGVVGAGSFKAAYNLGLWYEVSGNRGKAAEYYRQSALAGFKPASERLADILVKPSDFSY